MPDEGAFLDREGVRPILMPHSTILPCLFLDISDFSASVGRMKKVNTNKIPEVSWSSPGGKYSGYGKQVSEQLGREPASLDLIKRHPFDIEICRIPSGKTPYPYHSHSAQWEFYHVISGTGQVRDENGLTSIETGDAFLFKPGQAHQILNDGDDDLVLYVIADNPIGESYFYPDSNKWGVPLPDRRFIRSDSLDYYDGEE